ncbi:Acylamino-acid-releasing enzyme [Portunus trituberculatus]|uniref:Acylamino-acid-releasing enzyme n=1 Tax=Portunus trituberculatus TaxID=210409 RepID=A0A5B7K2X4_PORTR|nr:Acylamino-acid-releasing enzyme [Portunus trituberculatus]
MDILYSLIITIICVKGFFLFSFFFLFFSFLQSVVCFLNVNTKELSCHELPDNLCPAQMVWTADGTGVFGVAFESQPFRLGLVYCHNRVSKLFHMDLNGTFSMLSGQQSLPG